MQQLAGVLAVQLQVVNGADDLSVHVPDAHTPQVRGERERESRTEGEEGDGKKREKREGGSG